MAQFWVVGGKFTDAHCHEALDDSEIWTGPFADFEVARREWVRRSYAEKVGSESQYRIERINADEPPLCTD